ncbi:hypothetical protein [Halalkalibacter nanhaiisediminis]|uniref:Uncharacterized protein n=1 Tax=Halalkalibacter nanhaiisediminis TaxID=688079 RepID=A0A562QHV4_9BACI|nr:hypothetical protein [Halalkalibacter nanhaiisediminis]TWI56332.1 hypothetical protein IQ10_02226 [Halalkalibacter nanhaiisediminis]
MLLRNKVQKLKELFKESLIKEEIDKEFDLKFGNNGVILRPKDIELRMLCVKSPMIGILKSIKPVQQEVCLNKEEQEIFNEVFSNKGVLTYSVEADILNYKEIIKHTDLIGFIPTFYYYEDNTEHDFIIMDYIDGDYLEKMVLSDCTQPVIDKLDGVFCKFKEKGFDIGDRLEAIFIKEENKYIIIDLGGLVKE